MKQSRQLFSIPAAAVFIFTVLNPIHAQLIGSRLVYDLNPGAAGSYPTNLTAFRTNIFFKANTPSTGAELWRSDGAGIFLVSNINNTVTDLGGGAFVGNSSSPKGMTVFNNMLCFSAYDPFRGDELWRTDGTNAFRVGDISPDADDTLKTNPNSSFPSGFTVLGNELFFTANGGTTKPNYELWKYNGTSVSQVANIHPDSGSDFSSYPSGMTAFKGALYFMADDGSNGYELWRSTGTNATLFANINPGNAGSSSYPQYFTAFNNRLYFQAYTSSSGYELWQTDGTNVSQVADLNPGSAGSYPQFLTVFNNALYFRATDGVHGWELWKYDGTNASLVTDLNSSGDAFPEWLTVFNGSLYFSATTLETGYEVWRYDGTNVMLTKDINSGAGSSYPLGLTVSGNVLYFNAADDGVSNWELWKIWPAPFKITTIQKVGSDFSLSWATLGGSTNIIQTADSILGPFTNLGDPIIIEGVGEVITNQTDFGTIESHGTRFYRVVQP